MRTHLVPRHPARALVVTAILTFGLRFRTTPLAPFKPEFRGFTRRDIG
jgi:hypothetical protein